MRRDITAHPCRLALTLAVLTLLACSGASGAGRPSTVLPDRSPGEAATTARKVVVDRYPTTIEGVSRFILDTTPRLRRRAEEAGRLAKLIVEAAAEHDLDPRLVAAVVRHESHFRRGLRSCHPRGCDLGLGQVNELWIEELALDAERLQHDDRYNLRVTARLLAEARLGHEDDPRWWSRFHDHRPSRRAKYESRAMVWVTRATERLPVYAEAGAPAAASE
jgi:hypothetical protein